MSVAITLSGAIEAGRGAVAWLDFVWRAVGAGLRDLGWPFSLLDTLFVIGGVIFVAGLARILRAPGSKDGAFWRRGAVMTPNEAEFHARLRRACQEYEFWPQVSMLALLQPRSELRDPGAWRIFGSVSSRRVDWVLARAGKPLLVIELDDRTHDPAADRQRDALLAACGWPVLRFDSRRKPDVARLRAAINEALAKNERKEVV